WTEKARCKTGLVVFVHLQARKLAVVSGFTRTFAGQCRLTLCQPLRFRLFGIIRRAIVRFFSSFSFFLLGLRRCAGCFCLFLLYVLMIPTAARLHFLISGGGGDRLPVAELFG